MAQEEPSLPVGEAPGLPAAELGPVPPDAALTPVPSVRLHPREIARSFSTDGQFTAYGKDARLRSDVYGAAEEAKKELLAALRLNLLKKKDSWKHPVVLQVLERVPEGGKSAIGRIRLSADSSISIQIDVAVGAGLQRQELREEVLRWLLVEMMLRRVTGEVLETAGPLELPEWLLQGVLELLEHRGRAKPSETFAQVYRLGKTLTIHEILDADTDGMDSVSMSIYRVSACGLLLMLLEQPNGPERIADFISELPAASRGVPWLLEKHFPSLRGDGNMLEKWWSLELAASAEPALTELMSLQQSESQLAAILQLSFSSEEAKTPKSGLGKLGEGLKKILTRRKASDPTAENAASEGAANAAKAVPPEKMECDLAELEKFMPRKDRRQILQPVQVNLTRLTIRVHPFYRSIIADYQKLITRLQDGKERGVVEALEGLKQRRGRMAADAQAVEDYLDWFEATQAREKTGAFRGYLRAADELERPPARKTDSISRYLDSMEKEYSAP